MSVRNKGKVLVTGAAGFIGSNLVDGLLSAGYRVTGLDALTDYYPAEIKTANISRALANDSFGFVKADINHMEESELRDILDGVGCVMHLAAQPGVRGSWGRSFDVYLERNLLATQRLLETITTSKGEGRRFVFASSSSIYGSADDGPVTEDSPRRPTSPYGLTKLGGEELISVYRREHGLDATMLRYFTVYGPRQRPEMALANFIARALDGRPLEVFGDGEQSREMTYVSDIVDATIAAMDAPDGTYNVGGGARTTINNVIDILRDSLGEDIAVNYSERAAGDVRNTWADLSHATKNLGYEPKIGLEEGIAAQVAHIREQRQTAS